MASFVQSYSGRIKSQLADHQWEQAKSPVATLEAWRFGDSFCFIGDYMIEFWPKGAESFLVDFQDFREFLKGMEITMFYDLASELKSYIDQEIAGAASE